MFILRCQFSVNVAAAPQHLQNKETSALGTSYSSVGKRTGAKHLQRAIFNDGVIREKWRWAGQGMAGCGTTSHATIDGQRRTDVAGQLATTSKISGPPALFPARHRDPRGLHDGLLHASPLSTTHWNRRRRCPACPAGLQWTRHVGGLAGPRWSEEGKGKGAGMVSQWIQWECGAIAATRRDAYGDPIPATRTCPLPPARSHLSVAGHNNAHRPTAVCAMLYSAFPSSQQVSGLTSHDDRSCSAYETIGEVTRYIVALAVVIQLHPA